MILLVLKEKSWIKKGVSHSLKEMFRNYWEVVVELFKQDPDNESNRHPDNRVKNNIRRINFLRLTRRRFHLRCTTAS